jgi:hypothetical protein
MLAKRPLKKATRPSHRGAARALLTKALETLTQRDRGATTVTVAELCRVADISRNSLYRYHAPILKTLREYQRRGPKFAQQRLASRPRSGAPRTSACVKTSQNSLH